MTRLEVRCCCNPTRLIGYLEVREQLIYPGGSIDFVIPARRRLADLRAGDGPVEEEIEPARKVTLPVERIAYGSQVWLALKSDETPIEILRQIPGFIENS